MYVCEYIVFEFDLMIGNIRIYTSIMKHETCLLFSHPVTFPAKLVDR